MLPKGVECGRWGRAPDTSRREGKAMFTVCAGVDRVSAPVGAHARVSLQTHRTIFREMLYESGITLPSFLTNRNWLALSYTIVTEFHRFTHVIRWVSGTVL